MYTNICIYINGYIHACLYNRDDFLKLMPYFPQVAEELRKSNERIIRCVC